MVAQVESRRKNRDDEPVTGFDRVHSIALKLANRFFSTWFPTSDDLYQAAALAAAEALAIVGESSTLGQICPLLRKSLYDQAFDYGLRYTTNRKAGTQQIIRREIVFCVVISSKYDPTLIEAGRSAVGIGQFTYQAAYALHRLTNMPDPEETGTTQKDELLKQLHQIMSSDPELQALQEWYTSRSSFYGYEAMERENFCSRTKGYSLIRKARLLAGVELTSYDLRMAERVAEEYQSAADKRHRQVGRSLGISKTSVQKWLTIARALGLLPPEITTKERIRAAYQENPQASGREIARLVGVSKTTVLEVRRSLLSQGSSVEQRIAS